MMLNWIKSQKLIIDIENLLVSPFFSEQKRFITVGIIEKKSNWHIAIKAEKIRFL